MDFTNLIKESILEIYPTPAAIMENSAHKLMAASVSNDAEFVEATLVAVSMTTKICLNIVREENKNEALV